MVQIIFGILPIAVLLFGIRKWRELKWGFCNNRVQLRGKYIIITGANSGIGYEMAKQLALRGATVILACRNILSAQQAIIKIEEETGHQNLKLVAKELDLAWLESIKTFANNIKNEYPNIHILINNAGLSFPSKERHLTKDGLEIHFGVNYLGHFYLTNLLIDTLKTSAPSRIINISSLLHERGVIQFKDINMCQTSKLTNLYANSKLANIYFSRELMNRLKGTGVAVYAVCPGWVYTNLFRHSLKWYHFIMMLPIVYFAMRTPYQGAQTIIYCATQPELEIQNGLIYRDCKWYNSKTKFDDKISETLWNKSLALIKEKQM